MSDKQPSKHRKTEHRQSSSRRMEDDLNRSSFRSGGTAGRPPHDKVPHTSAADPYVPPMGDKSHRAATTARPLTSNETGQGATFVQPLVGNESGQVAPTWIPPQEGNAAPVVDAPAGPFYDGSHADMRGAVPQGTSMGRITVAIWPPDSIRRWLTTARLLPGQSTAISRCRGTPRGHQPMGTRMAVRAPTPEEPHFRRPSTVERGRANPRTPSIISRAS
jgi:hypothetical protein